MGAILIDTMPAADYCTPLRPVGSLTPVYTSPWAATSWQGMRVRHGMEYREAIAQAQQRKNALEKEKAEERAAQPLLGLLSPRNVHAPWEERQRMCHLATRDRATKPMVGV